MGWCVYMLRCGDGTLYTGATNDLARRVAAHAAGRGARYTRSRLPVEVVFQRHCRDRGAALRLEAAIKRLDRGEKIEVLRGRARPPTRRPRVVRSSPRRR